MARSKRPRTLAKRLLETRKHYGFVRKRFAAILYHGEKHNVSKDDQFYGFAYLDLLRDDIADLEEKLSKIAVSLTPPPPSDA